MFLNGASTSCVLISDWISLDVPRWVHTSFCSYYFELSPRDLRFRVLSLGIPGNLKAHARYRSNGSRRYEKVFSDIRSPEVIWDRVNAFTANTRVRSENRDLVKRVVLFISCVVDLDCGFWSLGSGSRPHGGGLEYARNGASSS